MNKRVLAVLFVVLLIVISIVFTAFQGKKTAASTAKDFVSAVQKKDADKSYELFSAYQKSVLTKAKWTANLATINAQIGTNKFTRTSDIASPNPQVSFAYYDVKNGATTYKLNIAMSGSPKWAIDSLEFAPINPGNSIKVTPVQKTNE